MKQIKKITQCYNFTLHRMNATLHKTTGIVNGYYLTFSVPFYVLDTMTKYLLNILL